MHWAQDEVDAAIVAGGDTKYDSQVFGVDVTLPLYTQDSMWLSTFSLQGEWYTGENTSDVRGGILQGINTTTGETIDSTGYWAELNVGVYSNKESDFRNEAALGYSSDDPDNDDLSAGTGARAKNSIFYLMDKFVWGAFTTGVEIQVWKTEYLDLEDGKNTRIKLFFQLNF